LDLLVLARPIPLKDIADQMGAVGGVLAMLSSGNPLSMATLKVLLSLSTCGTSSEAGDGVIVGFSLGSDALSNDRGTMIGNLMVIALVMLSVIILAGCIVLRQRTAMLVRRREGNIHFYKPPLKLLVINDKSSTFRLYSTRSS
jgi:hypothetical protein